MQLNKINHKVLELFADNINYYVFWKDRNSVFLGCNQKLADLLGLNDKSDIIGLTDFELPSIKEEAENFRTIDQRIMKSGIPELDFEEKHTQFDGSIKWLRTSKYPIKDDNNKVIGIVGWFSDITELKKMQIDIDENSKVIYQNNLTLKKLNNQLEISNLDLEKFTYAASHDLKNPLRIIQMGLELIELKNKTNYNKETINLFYEVKKSANVMSNLINDILDYAKTGSANMVLEKADLNEIVDEKIFLLQNIIKEKNVQLNINLPREKIKCYPSLIGMVFYNLISNGIKFNESKVPKIELSFSNNGNYWFFDIKDNGIGIPTDSNEAIFKAFNRLHNAEKYEGSGIGLSICRRIATLHKGFIEVKENPDGGSIFTFKILNFENQ